MIDPILYQSEVALRLDLRSDHRLRWPRSGWFAHLPRVARPRFFAAR